MEISGTRPGLVTGLCTAAFRFTLWSAYRTRPLPGTSGMHEQHEPGALRTYRKRANAPRMKDLLFDACLLLHGQ